MTLPRKGTPREGSQREPGTLRDLRPPSFADLLRRYRTTAGLTQEELAERATLSARAISDLERGLKTRPQRETIRLLAEALGLEATERARLAQSARPAATRSAPSPPVIVPGNLPAPPTPLVGRENAVKTVVARLRTQDVRLLAITGPGGVGKSRLALAVAELLRPDYPDGVFFVPLAAIDDPALVEAAIARPLGIAERGGQSLRETLLENLRAKRLLLVMDNFEHLSSAVALLDSLLANCREIAILATSRSALATPWCQEYPLSPLGLPSADGAGDLAALARVPAVALFVARAGAVRPDFRLTAANAPAVAGICRRLDGLPLALELAAARLRLLSPAALLERLDEPFRLLSSSGTDLPARQQTMRAAIEWSHDLLEPAERALFRRLAVFAGGGTIEAAEAICAAPPAPDDEPIDVLDLADRLVAQSLVRSSEQADDEPRLTMFETIRSFAREQLVAHGEEVATQEHHAAYYLAFAERVIAAMGSVANPELLEELEREHNNFRAALRLLIERRDAPRALRLSGALRRLWFLGGHLSEGRRWFDAALALPAVPDDRSIAAARALALDGASRLAYLQSDYQAVMNLGEQALAIRHDLGDRAGIAVVLNTMGVAANELGDNARALAYFEESLALRRLLDDQSGIASSLNNLGLLESARNDSARARERYEEALAIYRDLGDVVSIALVLVNLAILVEQDGDARRAVDLYEESLAQYRAYGNKEGLALATDNLAVTLRALGEYQRARTLHEESLAIWRELGTRYRIAIALTNLGNAIHQLGDPDQAALLHEESLGIFRSLEHRWGCALALNNLGRCRWSQGARARAGELLEESLALARAIDNNLAIVSALTELARVAQAAGDHNRARTALQECVERCLNPRIDNMLPTLLERLATLAADNSEPTVAARLFGTAAALRDRLGTPMPPSERPECDRTHATLRIALGEPAYPAAFAAGRALDPGAAAAEAMAGAI